MTPQKELKNIFFDILESISSMKNNEDITMTQDVRNLIPTNNRSNGTVIINNNHQTLTITNVTGLVAKGLRLAETIDVTPNNQLSIDLAEDPAKFLIEYLYEQDLNWHDAKKFFKDKFLMYVHQRHPKNEDFAHKLRVSSSQASALRKSIGATPRKYLQTT
jgi:hypothetical protein